jgi:signal transduction histidine kinase
MSPKETSDGGHERLTSALRVLAASAGAAIFWIDPTESGPRRPIAYAVLVGFVLYGIVSHLLVLTRSRRLPMAVAPWVDLGWTTLLIAVSEGTSSIFFQLYLFAILVASFHGGFRPGMSLVLASVLSFSVVGGLTAPTGPSFELDRSLIRPLYLLVLGYLISHWGEHERRLRARMALLREVTSLSNPRFGIDRMVARLLEAMRSFHAADGCRLVVRDSDGACWSRAATLAAGKDAAKVEVPAGLARRLLPAPGSAAFVYARRTLRSWPDTPGKQRLEGAGEVRPDGDQLAAALDAEEFAAVPFRFWPDGEARLYLLRRRARGFNRSDVEFLQHVVDQVTPVLNSIRLVDKLASDAADEERSRIARDIHDSIIQPYIGLKLGLSGVGDALESGRTDAASAGVARLAALVDAEIATLRRYVHGLSAASANSAELLPRALERFCTRFAEATGIQVTLATQLVDELNDRVTGEVFQMVAEGLSNVRRHTEASRANVRVASCDGWLRLDIENERSRDGNGMAFSPRSLTDRAEALGGRVDVTHPQGRTVLKIGVPL